MHRSLMQWLRDIAVWLFRALGSDIFDCQTGKRLGRGLLIPWRGKIHLLGADDLSLVPVALAQSRITYWHQAVGFTVHSEPDFPRAQPAISLLKSTTLADIPPQVLLVVLDHRAPEAVLSSRARWLQHGVRNENLLLAYGGDRSDFDRFADIHKIFIADQRLRTVDHQREAQSYRAVFSGVCEWMQTRPFTHILLMEYDQVPISADPVSEYLKTLLARDADVLCHKLQRVDGTIHPHWLASPKVPRPRAEVFSMMGTGNIWKREAWEAVAGSHLLCDWYLELDLPTSAFDLGFRMVGLPEQDRFVVCLPEHLPCCPAAALAAGAWTLHPVKISASLSAIAK